MYEFTKIITNANPQFTVSQVLTTALFRVVNPSIPVEFRDTAPETIEPGTAVFGFSRMDDINNDMGFFHLWRKYNHLKSIDNIADTLDDIIGEQATIISNYIYISKDTIIKETFETSVELCSIYLDGIAEYIKFLSLDDFVVSSNITEQTGSTESFFFAEREPSAAMMKWIGTQATVQRVLLYKNSMGTYTMKAIEKPDAEPYRFRESIRGKSNVINIHNPVIQMTFCDDGKYAEFQTTEAAHAFINLEFPTK